MADIQISSTTDLNAVAAFSAALNAQPTPIASTSSTLPLSPTSPTADSADGPAPVRHRRTREGCLSCRARKKKCSLERPACRACVRLELVCEWEGARHEEERKRKRDERRVERREERERGRRERAKDKERERAEQPAAEGRAVEGDAVDVAEWEAAPVSGVGVSAPGESFPLGSGTGYDPAAPGLFMGFPAYPTASAAPLPTSLPYSVPPPSSSWIPFLGSFASNSTYPVPPDAASPWPNAFPSLAPPQIPLLPPPPPLPAQASLAALVGKAATPNANSEIASATDLVARADAGSPGLDWMALLRSPSPPAFPASFTLPANFPSISLPFSPLSAAGLAPIPTPSAAIQPHAPPLPSIVTRATSLLVSADFEFTKAYLLSHYATSLARGVSLAASDSSSRPATPSGRRAHHGSSSSSASASASASSAAKSANLFLGLIPLAHRHPYLLNSILSWSAANLAVTSNGLGGGDGPPSAEGSSVMSGLSDELGVQAQQALEEAFPALQIHLQQQQQQHLRRDCGGASTSAAVDWEPPLAAWIMLVQASICRGDTALWRLRLRQAASIVSLAGGVSVACKTPLARQLVRNLLYHEVLSRGPGAEEGLLLDYEGLRGGKGRGGKGSPGGEGRISPRRGALEAQGEDVEGQEQGGEVGLRDGEGEAEELDTLMGTAESVFLLIGRITSLAKQKRQAVQQNGDAVAEDALAPFLQEVEDIKTELEEEKQRFDTWMQERPDLEAHRYFHEVLRLAALCFLNMVLELPPRALPMVMLVRKMLSLTEVIVAENLPGLCSMHWCLSIMQLNSTPLISPHSFFGSDRARSIRLFDTQMNQFKFLNTNRSRQLIEEAWRRSNDGRIFVDPDHILAEWKWDLNLA
ncbi:hypothetical protein JCM6882_009265 [Rhodosporidiobolus microsporus]